MLLRTAAAASLLAACGTLGMIVLARLYRPVEFEPGTTAFVSIDLFCPRCHRRQKLPLGDARCGGCGLKIVTQVEEPRCAGCGYLLYGSTSTTCPECGRPVAAAPAGV
jgi:hypothetical protein